MKTRFQSLPFKCNLQRYTAGLDGAVYEWKLKDFKREKENVLKGCNYTCVVSTPDSRNIYAVGSDKKLKEFDETNQISKEYPTGSVLTQVVLSVSGRTLFAVGLCTLNQVDP